MDSKPFYQSTTVWFNVLGAVVVLLQYVGTLHLPVNPTMQEGIIVIVNLVNRFRTSQAVSI